MTSPSLEIQGLLVSRLKGTGSVSSLVNGVYDSVPADPWGSTEAYISFGAESMVPDDADCVAGETITIQVDVWSRKTGRVQCKRIMDAVKAALHLRDDIPIADNAIVECRLVLTQVLKDPDGLTTHGVMQFEFAVEAE